MKICKVDKEFRLDRSYTEFLRFMQERPDLPVTQIDSAEGRKRGSVLLTIHFVKAEFMLAYLMDANDSQSVIDIFKHLYLELRPDRFMTLMPVLLGDNGNMKFTSSSILLCLLIFFHSILFQNLLFGNT